MEIFKQQFVAGDTCDIREVMVPAIDYVVPPIVSLTDTGILTTQVDKPGLTPGMVACFFYIPLKQYHVFLLHSIGISISMEELKNRIKTPAC